jgi:hypothetical protein
VLLLAAGRFIGLPTGLFVLFFNILLLAAEGIRECWQTIESKLLTLSNANAQFIGLPTVVVLSFQPLGPCLSTVTSLQHVTCVRVCACALCISCAGSGRIAFLDAASCGSSTARPDPAPLPTVQGLASLQHCSQSSNASQHLSRSRGIHRRRHDVLDILPLELRCYLADGSWWCRVDCWSRK